MTYHSRLTRKFYKTNRWRYHVEENGQVYLNKVMLELGDLSTEMYLHNTGQTKISPFKKERYW